MGILDDYKRDLNEACWDGYPRQAFDRDSLAVVACDGVGHGCVLWTAGPHVRAEIEEGALTDLSDLGLDDAPKGISVWSGRAKYGPSDHEFGDEFEGLGGAFRQPSHGEWRSIARNECPWPDTRWRMHTRYVLWQPEMGVYLGNALGLGFWSKLDPVGQPCACTFESVERAFSFVKDWAEPPPKLEAKPITAIGLDFDWQQPPAVYASVALCEAAGLEGWTPWQQKDRS